MAATRQPHRALSLTGCFDLQGAAQATPFAISNRLPFPTTGTNERVAEIKHDANFRMKPSLEDMVITPRLLQVWEPLAQHGYNSLQDGISKVTCYGPSSSHRQVQLWQSRELRVTEGNGPSVFGFTGLDISVPHSSSTRTKCEVALLTNRPPSSQSWRASFTNSAGSRHPYKASRSTHS